MSIDKTIIALSDFEHVLKRSTMYVGSLDPSEEKVVIVRDNKLVNDVKEISVGFYKLMGEVLDNAFDEAKRQKGQMERIEIHFNSKDSSVRVVDTGGGFINASIANSKTGLSNVETAMTMLRAGSNFENENTSENLIGTNGVGASVVNMLSDIFYIKTVNNDEVYEQTWTQFQDTKVTVRKRKEELTGTEIKYTPRKDKFKKCKWDKEYIHTLMVFRKFLMKNDPEIGNLEFVCSFDNEILDLNIQFLPEELIKVENKFGTFFLWETYSNAASVSFVNGAQCTGIHQRILLDYVNSLFENNIAGRFYESLIMLNLSPKHVKFGDQNKTRFVTSRSELTPILDKNFFSGIKRELKNSSLYDNILRKIAEAEKEGDMRNLKNKKRAQKAKISDKFFPPSGKTSNLFLVEGGCIDENQEIITMTEHGIEDKILKAIVIGDYVLTHNHRWKRVDNVSKKISKGISITTHGEVLNSGENHKWFVYDISNDKFYFLEANKINLEIHKLVKNRLSNFSHIEEVISVQNSGNENFPILITFEESVIQMTSLTHKFCVYDENDSTFQMKESQNLKAGNLIAVFERL